MDFKNTIIILTSNLGSQYLLDGITESGQVSESAKAAIHAELRGVFRPEFLNRLDEIIFFNPLTKADIARIIDIQIENLAGRLAGKLVKLRFTEAAKEHVIENGYDPVYGARPLKRYLQAKAETLIAKTLLGGEVHAGATIVVDCGADGLLCRIEE